MFASVNLVKRDLFVIILVEDGRGMTEGRNEETGYLCKSIKRNRELTNETNNSHQITTHCKDCNWRNAFP